MEREPPPAPLASTELGSCRVIEEVGHGTFATVYRGRHLTLDRDVAIKVLNARYYEDPGIRERFRREAVSAGRISHPNVVTIFDFGETPEKLGYLIMEWVEGSTLFKVLKATAPLPLARSAYLARQIASGLGAAHHLGLVHRDLKASNVMLSLEEASLERVKLVDFGLVLALNALNIKRLTSAGQMVGTPFYMAPETIREEEPTPATDLYALGVILYEMLTATRPFNGKTIDVLRAHLRDLPAPPPLSAGLGPLAMRLLEKDPRMRPQSAEEVVAELDRLDLPSWDPARDPLALARARTASYPSKLPELLPPPALPPSVPPQSYATRAERPPGPASAEAKLDGLTITLPGDPLPAFDELETEEGAALPSGLGALIAVTVSLPQATTSEGLAPTRPSLTPPASRKPLGRMWWLAPLAVAALLSALWLWRHSLPAGALIP